MNIVNYINNNDYTVILCLGDSITEANHCTEGHLGYVGLLDEALRIICTKKKFLVINAGIGGKRITDSTVFLRNIIQHIKPDITTIMFGMNDCAESTIKVEDFCNALESLVEFVKTLNSRPILFTQNPLDYKCNIQNIQRRKRLPEFMKQVKLCADKTNVKFIDVYHKWYKEVLALSSNDHLKLMHDGIHPNNYGHQFIFEQIKQNLIQ